MALSPNSLVYPDPDARSARRSRSPCSTRISAHWSPTCSSPCTLPMASASPRPRSASPSAHRHRSQLPEKPGRQNRPYQSRDRQTRGKQIEEEGCLSLPDIREKVSAPRGQSKAQDDHGEWFELEGEELLARAFQHEIDHLDGVLFIVRISRSSANSSCARSANCKKPANGR